MKFLLFLYPIKPYFDAEIKLKGPFFQRNGISMEETLKRFDEILHTKYRTKGYRVIFVCFGLEEHLYRPDTTCLASHLSFRSDDQFVSCGMSWREFTKKRAKTYIYPDPGNVFVQLPILPQLATEIVVSGFHEADCVNRFVDYGKSYGANIRTDASLTEKYFAQVALGELSETPYAYLD